MLESFKRNLARQSGKKGDSSSEGVSWMHHQLHFTAEDEDVTKARDPFSVHDYELYDPRNPLNKRRRERDQADAKERDRRRAEVL